MTDTATNTDDTPVRERDAARARPRDWRGAQDAWRFGRRLNRRYVNNVLRVRSATALPRSIQARILAMGIPSDIMTETLREIRSLDAWPNAWIETAQRFLGDYRRQISGSQRADAAQARMLAGLCYHIAQLVPGPDQRTVEHCSATAATLVGQAIGEIMPQARRLEIPWRNHALSSILIPGPDSDEPAGLVVMLNGTTTVKEELLRWTEAFVAAGQAVLLMDTPGTGDARELGPPSPDHNDLLDGVFDLLRGYPAVDARKVGVLGVSIGGNIALRCLAYDRRIAGAALVTPPYDPARWVERISPLEQEELSRLFQLREGDDLHAMASAFSLEEIAPQVQRPTLIFGGARDVVVPPSDATRLAAALGERSTLVWYPEGGHVLYEQLPAWTTDAAYWFDAVMHRQSTRVEDLHEAAAAWRAALDQAPEPEINWDESMESARLLSADEVAVRPVEEPAEEGSEVEQTPTRRQRGAPEEVRPAPREYDDEYSRAFDEDSDQRLLRRRPSRARRQQNNDLPME